MKLQGLLSTTETQQQVYEVASKSTHAPAGVTTYGGRDSKNGLRASATRGER